MDNRHNDKRSAPRLGMAGALRWLWTQSRGSRGAVAASALMGVLRVCAGLSFVWMSKLLIDVATGAAPGSERLIWRYSIFLALLMIAEMCLNLSVGYITARAEAGMKNRLRASIYAHLLCSGRNTSKRMHSGDLLSRLTEDVRVVTDAVCLRTADVVVMVAQLLGAFFMLYAMSPVLALCCLGIMPVFLLLSKAYIRRLRTLTADIRHDEARVQTSMQEGLQHHAAVQTLECEPMMVDRLDALQHSFFGRVMSRARYSTFSRAMIRMGFMAGYLTAFIWSVWHLHSGAITFGTMTAFLQLVSRMQSPMSGLLQSVSPFIYAMSSADRLDELQDFPSEDKSRPLLLPKPVGVRLDGVTFAYPDGEEDVLSAFSYDFSPGSKTVVMGQTGCGKSTLAKLILALLKPASGTITVYSGSSGQQAPASPATRCNMVYVPQGNSLLEGTVRENLLLGKPTATEAELREALTTAMAEFVFELPRGLDTPCGELGAGLSEGQAQRVAIARALLRDGGLLLLDEFNSALDPATAAELMRRLSQSRASSTIIFISHRPEVAAFCDAVLRL